MPPYMLKANTIPDLSETDLGATLTSDLWGVITRATYARYPDAQFPWACTDVKQDAALGQVWETTRQLGIRFGCFGFMLQGKIQEQISGFVSAVKSVGIFSGGRWLAEIPPIADVEVDWQREPAKKPAGYISPIAGAAWADQVKQYLDGLESELGIRPMIYTARYNGWPRLLDSAGNPPGWEKLYEFWLKYYPYTSYQDGIQAFPPSALPTGITLAQVLFWQYEQYGRSLGFKWNDLNSVTAAGMGYFAAPPPAQQVPNDTGDSSNSTGGQVPTSPNPVTITIQGLPAGTVVNVVQK